MTNADIMRGFMARVICESIDRNKVEVLFHKYFWSGDVVEIDDQGFVSIHSCEPLPTNRKAVIKLPVKFNEMAGTFNCNKIGLRTLAGGPPKAHNYYCNENELTSLEFGPTTIVNGFSCRHNKLTSLVGAPTVGGYFECQYNPLESLEGLPEQVGNLQLSYTSDLPLLRLLAISAGSTFRFAPKSDKTREVLTILQKHRNGPRRPPIIACQKELIDAGYEANASW